MSVTGNSCVSTRPTSTIVGCRDLTTTTNTVVAKHPDLLTEREDSAATATVSTKDDKTFSYETCAWFERKLDLKRYLRDKRNEEHPQYERYVRINSKTLRCSYQIPAEQVHGFLTRLHSVLAPGLRAESREKSSVGKSDVTNREVKHVKVLKNWMACSDWTVQVFPKTPSVLWLDLECMPCKTGGGKKRERHMKSKAIIETVYTVISDYRKNADITVGPDDGTAKHDVLYVTRGKTCGMHLFFPEITIDSEDEVQDVWAAVNRRLVETGQTAAIVDTGCSAMPLPLSRNHNGLTRVEISRSSSGGDDDDSVISVKSFQVISPSFRDLARVTNFYHFLADTPSPPQSVVSGIDSECTVSGVSKRSTTTNKRSFVDTLHSDTRIQTGSGTSGLDSATIEEGFVVKRGRRIIAATIDDGIAEETVSTATIPLADDAAVGTRGKNITEDITESVGNDRAVTIHTPNDRGEKQDTAPDSSNNNEKEEDFGRDTDDDYDDDDDICKGEMIVEADSGLGPVENYTDTERTEAAEKKKNNDRLSNDLDSLERNENKNNDRLAKDLDGLWGRNDRDDVLSHLTSSSKTSSHSSTRLLQTDIRELCAKASKMPRRLSNRSLGKRTNSVRDHTELDTDTASSFVGRGYEPSVKSLKLLTATEDEGDDATYAGSIVSRIRDGHETTACTSNSTSRVAVGPQRPQPSSSRPVTDQQPSFTLPPQLPLNSSSLFASLRALYVRETIPPEDVRLPRLVFTPSPAVRRSAFTKEDFKNSMRLRLDDDDRNRVNKTDMQLIMSCFETELQFHDSMMNNTTPVTGDGFDELRIKDGGSLNANRENCPAALFPEHVPRVIYAEDYVAESEWYAVLVRYYDEYLNSAPFLYVMMHVLQRDENVKTSLTEAGRQETLQCVQNCLLRFRHDVIGFQTKTDTESRVKTSNVPKQPHEEKCTIVSGLIAICSLAFKMVTPVFTDLAKVCRLLLGNDQQTLDTLNASTVSSTGGDDDDCSYDCDFLAEEFDDSVSQAGDAVDRRRYKTEFSEDRRVVRGDDKRHLSANIGNNHSVIASLLRWNYPALGEQTRWSLFFYYHHVHTDALTRIMDEVLHGGLMVTAVLQAYFEDFSNNTPVDVRLVCSRVYKIDAALRNTSDHEEDGQDDDQALMPPPSKSRGRHRGKKTGGGGGGGGQAAVGGHSSSRGSDQRRNGLAKRNDNTAASNDAKRNGNGAAEDDSCDFNNNSSTYKTSVVEVLTMMVKRYFRPVSFDETTAVYTETGYEQCQNEYSSFFSPDKERKRTVMDVFNRGTLKYTMPHGDLLLYNTDVMGTVHRRSSCTNNLVLNVFENMYGGCMTYLTRRYNNHLKLFNRFNGDAYRLVVECRHAMNELVRSIDHSYINLILRLPIVPAVLETDFAIRHMFMSKEEIQKGTFVCLNAMDYVRAINMFTRHSRFSQGNCESAESFLDSLIDNRNSRQHRSNGGDKDTRDTFRTVYLFFLLYVFEVLYKIRHAYNRDRTYNVSIERLSMEIDVRELLKMFFGTREFQMPRGLSANVIKLLDMSTDLYDDTVTQDILESESENKTTGAARCINTRPVISTQVPDKMSRMAELFARKGLVVMKSYAALGGGGGGGGDGSKEDGKQQRSDVVRISDIVDCEEVASSSSSAVYNRFSHEESHDTGCSSGSGSGSQDEINRGYVERDRSFLHMSQADLEKALYSSATWYENCRVRLRAASVLQKEAKRLPKTTTTELEMCMDAKTMNTFLQTQLNVNIDNDRLNHIDRAVREERDFAFCVEMPLRLKMIALVLATHATKRMTTDVATEFVRKTYSVERTRARFTKQFRATVTGGTGGDSIEDPNTTATTMTTHAGTGETEEDHRRPDTEWKMTWKRLLSKRRCLLEYCRSMADTYFPHDYFIGLQPDDAYNALYNYMRGKQKYTTLRSLEKQPWAKDVCTALNYLLVMNAYDPDLVELCLRLFLGFEWPGQWAKRIFVWKSNSNAGKSFFFEHILRKAFDQSTCINDPKGGKENAPEKSEYYKNFVLMINEFTNASAGELKKLCSTSSYKFRMNFANQMIQAFMVGKMVFNCNTLPLTTDHATIQRVALVPLPFWFQKRQSIVDAMLNWTKDQSLSNDYERQFRRNISNILEAEERRFFIEHRDTKNEDDLFNRPNDVSRRPPGELSDQNAKASMFLVQNKTSQVYMLSSPPTGTIISGIVLITRYFCRFRFFSNNLKEPVDYSALPTACTAAAQEWQRVSQPYFDWKERYRVQKDYTTRTKVSVIYASLNHYAKNCRNAAFFDLRQFFECDFAEQKIPYYNAREDEYNVCLDPIED